MSRKRFAIYLLVLAGLLSWVTYYGPEHQRFLKNPKVSASPRPKAMLLDFPDAASLKSWKPYSFTGETKYEVVSEPGGAYLRAVSEKSSSALFHAAETPIEAKPQLIWEWRVVAFPQGKKREKFGDKQDNDFAARVYVAFEGKTRFRHDVIQYTWDETYPEGTFADTSSLNRVKSIVIQTGPGDGSWVLEKRDLVKDYEMLYGKPPESKILVIGLMTDSDNTGSTAEGHFKRFSMEYLQTAARRTKRRARPAPWMAPVDLVSRTPEKAGEAMKFVFDKTLSFGRLLTGQETKKNPGLDPSGRIDPSLSKKESR